MSKLAKNQNAAKPAEHKLARRINVKVTAAEGDAIDAKARKAGLTLSKWIRKKLTS